MLLVFSLQADKGERPIRGTSTFDMISRALKMLLPQKRYRLKEYNTKNETTISFLCKNKIIFLFFATIVFLSINVIVSRNAKNIAFLNRKRIVFRFLVSHLLLLAFDVYVDS